MISVQLNSGKVLGILFRRHKVQQVNFSLTNKDNKKGTSLKTIATWAQLFDLTGVSAKIKGVKQTLPPPLTTGIWVEPSQNVEMKKELAQVLQDIDSIRQTLPTAQKPMHLAWSLVRLAERRQKLMDAISRNLTRPFSKERARKMALREAMHNLDLNRADRAKVWLVYFGRTDSTAKGHKLTPSQAIRFMGDASQLPAQVLINAELNP